MLTQNIKERKITIQLLLYEIVIRQIIICYNRTKCIGMHLVNNIIILVWIGLNNEWTERSSNSKAVVLAC